MCWDLQEAMIISSSVARSQTTPGHCTRLFFYFFLSRRGRKGRAGGMLPSGLATPLIISVCLGDGALPCIGYPGEGGGYTVTHALCRGSAVLPLSRKRFYVEIIL